MLPLDRQIVLAKALIENRQSRGRFLPKDIFGECAWDALLHLFIADSSNEQLSALTLSRRCGCPATVMRRWLKFLEEQDVVVRSEGRANCNGVVLTPRALDMMEGYLSATAHDVKALASVLNRKQIP